MRAVTIVLVVAAVLAASVGLLWVFQRHLIYLPSPGPVPPAASALPGGEDVSFETADGLRLGGWFLPGAVDSPGRSSSRGEGSSRPGPAVLVCNGNGGDRSMRAALAVALSRLGLAVLLFDYRGYGGNPGSPSEDGLTADARAALDYLAGRPEVDPRRVVYLGESLGAAVALRLAVERPPAALVLRSPFASLAEVGRRHYPVLPVSLLLRDRYDSAALAGRLSAPLLVVAGGRDRIVPASHSRRLFAAAPQPKRLVVLEGADHNDHDLLAGPRLVNELRAFLAGVPRLLD
jgi:uncharacterized protein